MTNNIVQAISDAGGRAYLIGGAVRDMLMGHTPKDFDYEVFGLTSDQLLSILSEFGEVGIVGKSFGVYSIGKDIEFSLPRRERKVALGHRGFDVQVDPDMSLEDASLRRDFTVNAIFYDSITDEIFDPRNGRKDIKNKILRPVNEETFVEDPLRILRCARFIAQKGFRPVFSIHRLAQEVANEYASLAVERIWDEWRKMMLGNWAHVAVDWLMSTSWAVFYPELRNLCFTPQDAQHHPEGRAWTHTVFVLENMINRTPVPMEEDRILRLRFAALLHDIGKTDTTEITEDGRITTYNHNNIGADMLETFFHRIGATRMNRELVNGVEPLVREHMFHVFSKNATARSVRRLANRLHPATVNDWYKLVCADKAGRPPLPKTVPAIAEEIKVIAEGQKVLNNRPEKIMQGRHLIDLGLEPGKHFGEILDKLYEDQLDGEFDTEESGIEWYEAEVARRTNFVAQ